MKRFWALLFLGLWACDDGASSESPAADATAPGVDAGPDAALFDAYAPADASIEPSPSDADTWQRPHLAPEVEPEAIATAWRLGAWTSGDLDRVADDIEHDRFVYPDEGTDARGVDWTTLAEAGANGELGDFASQGSLYAAAQVTLDPGEHLFARTESTIGVYTNGWLQPGDVYHSRRHRVPLATHAGDNLVVVRAFGGRGQPEAALWRTTDEVVFNFVDLTPPDLRVGESEALPLGVAVLNLTDRPLADLRARVVESDHLQATEVRYPSVGPFGLTQIGFTIAPKQPFADFDDPPEGEPAGEVIPVRLRIESPDLEHSYERTVELRTVRAEAPYRRTFVSPVDHSVQYYGVQPPSDLDPQRDYGLVLSLHGAGVEGIGQAQAYSKKDWAYVIAPTNRRPFGFDWEVWGQLQGLNALDDAMRTFAVDPTMVHVTGHSMGGHGTWQFGILHPGRFAVVGPSAGWMSFYSYQGSTRPSSVFGRAAASSDTLTYIGNLARRAIYIIHGSADDNVPVREGRDNFAASSAVTDDAHYHEERGAGHWWDGDAAPGADCVDWPPLFDLMHERRLDPFELTFDYVSAGVQVNPDHAYVHLRSAETPLRDLEIHSMPEGGDTVRLDTDNVRSMVLDGGVLRAKGVARVVVDGAAMDVVDGPMPVGPQAGKRPKVNGPFHEVFYRPFCLVYPDDRPTLAAVAAYYTSLWNVIGNGHACALPTSRLTDALRTEYNLIHLGGAPDLVADLGWPLAWDDLEIRLGTTRFPQSALLFVFPEAGHLSAVLSSTLGEESLLYRVAPFSSRGLLPDFLIWSPEGGRAAGFFDAAWGWDSTLAVP